jgi:hypothetical protein
MKSRFSPPQFGVIGNRPKKWAFAQEPNLQEVVKVCKKLLPAHKSFLGG